MKTTFCTIASADFLPVAAVLVRSIRKIYGGDVDIVVLVVDRNAVSAELDAELLTLSDIPNPYLYDMAFRYDLSELTCAYKPFLLKTLLDRKTHDLVVFLDADIEIFSRFVEVEALAGAGAAIVLTPHSDRPREPGALTDDRQLLAAGAFNAGFIAVTRHDEALKFLHWWAGILRTECYLNESIGYVVRDQRWLGLTDSYFGQVEILRHRGYNVAHYNLPERLDVISSDLRFFHYTPSHLIDPDPDVFFKTYSIAENSALRGIFENYLTKLARAREDYGGFSVSVFSRTQKGHVIVPILRAAYRLENPQNRKLEDWAASDEIFTHLINDRDETGLCALDRSIQRFLAQKYEILFDLHTESDRQRLQLWIAEHGSQRFGLTDETLAHARKVRDNQIELESTAQRLRQTEIRDQETKREQRDEEHRQLVETAEVLQRKLLQLSGRTRSRGWLFRRLLRSIIFGKSGLAP